MAGERSLVVEWGGRREYGVLFEKETNQPMLRDRERRKNPRDILFTHVTQPLLGITRHMLSLSHQTMP